MQITPFEQCMQFTHAYTQGLRRRAWPNKATFFQSFVDQHVPVMVPIQQLEFIALAITKNKQVCTERIQLQDLLHDQRESIYLLSEIDRFAGDVHTGMGINTKHAIDELR